MTHSYGQAQVSSGSKKLPSAKASGVDGQRRAAGAEGHVSEEDVEEIYDIGRCGVLFDFASSKSGMPAAGILRFLQVPMGIHNYREQ